MKNNHIIKLDLNNQEDKPHICNIEDEYNIDFINDLKDLINDVNKVDK